MGLELLVDHVGRPHSGVRKWLESLQLPAVSGSAPPVEIEPGAGDSASDDSADSAVAVADSAAAVVADSAVRSADDGAAVTYLEIPETVASDDDLADAGMSTVEYAIGTVVAAAFAAVLYRIVTGDSVVAGLTNLVQSALNTNF